MMRNLESRLIKLEQPLAPRRPYVVRVGSPRTENERAQLAVSQMRGWPIAIMPHKCSSAAEWQAQYAPESAQQ